MLIALSDTDSAGIAAEFVRARTRAGSPAMGMVLTMVIVADEDQADTAMGYRFRNAVLGLLGVLSFTFSALRCLQA